MMRMMRRWLSRQGWPLLSRLAKEDAPAALRGRAGARYPRIAQPAELFASATMISDSFKEALTK